VHAVGGGERSEERMNSRNGYCGRRWDTRASTIDLRVPKLREGTYFPAWLLVHRRRGEQALASVVAQAYVEGVSTHVGLGGVESRRQWITPRIFGEPPNTNADLSMPDHGVR
jgi:Transposase, Mutator family